MEAGPCGPPWDGESAGSACQCSEAGICCCPHQLGLRQALGSVGSGGGDEVTPGIQASTYLHSRAG